MSKQFRKLENISKYQIRTNQWRWGDIFLGTYKLHISPTTMVVQQASHMRQWTISRKLDSVGQIHQHEAFSDKIKLIST